MYNLFRYPKKPFKSSAEIRHWKLYKTVIAAKELASIQKVKFPANSSALVLVAAGNKANLFDVSQEKIVKSFVDTVDVVTACAIRHDGISS